MRALVTGAGGFVGTYLCRALEAHGDEAIACVGPDDGGETKLDILDADAVGAALERWKPDVVFHLAAQSFVPDALASPMHTYVTNIRGTASVAQAIRSYCNASKQRVRLFFTSSAEVYGRVASHGLIPETAALAPANPYAGSKAAAEMLLVSEHASFGLDVVIARAFNHIGPGQSDRFVVASFARQLAEIAQGAPPQLYVGNLEAKRDMTDVRDVVRAYVLLAHAGDAGEVYNVCSGRAIAIRDILRELILAAHVPVEVREDPARMRPSDVPLFVGDASKLRAKTGWEPTISLQQSIRDIYAAERSNVAS